MTDISTRSTPWPVSRVIEFAADLAEAAVPWAESTEPIADTLLFDFWGEGRQLTNDWLRRVDLLENTQHHRGALDRDLILGTLANELFAMEVPSRLVGTVLAALDRQRKTPEYRPIAEHVLFAIQHVRARLLALILSGGEQHAAADRFRRRCERWTDMLIGPCLVRFGTAAYAHDARRSWEFGEDLLSDQGINVAQQLVRPSLLAAFRGPSGRSPIQSSSGESFLLSMMAMIPAGMMTTRLTHWATTSKLDRSDFISRHDSAAPADAETPGWSLLDRCLRIVEWRRKRGE